LSGALGFLDSAQAVLRVDSGVELAAAEVHAASVSLEMMIGAVGVEDLLEEIFSRFCIGK
jgi:tRNA modification GTPase